MAEVIEFDTSRAVAGIREMNRELNTFNQTAEQGRKAARDIFPDASEAKGVADAIGDLKREYQSLQTAAGTLRGALDRAVDPAAIQTYSEALAKAEKGLKMYETAAKKAGVELDNINKKGSLAKDVASDLFGAFTKATLIVEAIRLVKDFVQESFNLARQVAKTERQFAGFVGGVENAKKVLADINQVAANLKLPEKDAQAAAKSLLGFKFTAQELPGVLQRVADTARGSGKDFNELALIYGKARASGVLFAEDINQLTEAGIPVIGEFAKQLGVSEGQVKKLASEGKISFAELELALANLTKQGGLYYGQSVANADATDQLGASFEKLQTTVGQKVKPAFDSVVAGLEQIVTGITNVLKSGSIGDYFQRNAALAARALGAFSPSFKNLFDGIANGIEKIGTDYAAQAQQQKDAVSKGIADRLLLENNAEKARAAAAADASKKAAADAAKRAEELARLRVDALKEGEAKEIAQEQLRFDTLARELRKYHLSTEGAEQQHAENVSKIKLKYYLEQLTDAAEARQAEAESIQRGYTELEALANADAAARTARLTQNRQVQQNASELEAATFEAGLLKARDIFFRKRRSDAEITEYEKQVSKAREIFQLQSQAAELQRKLDFDKQLSAADRATVEQQIANLQEKARQAAEGVGDQGAGKEPFSFAKLLGLDPDNPDDQQLIAGVQRLGQEVAKAFTASADARLEAAQKAKQAAEESVDSAQSALDEQIKLAELGFASDVDLAKRRLDAAKEQREKALAEEEEAAARKRKIEEVQQVVSLITASANIYQSLSPLGPIGVGLAIATIATMLGAYVSAKARIKNTVKAREGMTGRIGSDGVIVGNRHESGGVLLEVEGDEFMASNGKRFGVVRREMTDKHFDLLAAVNANDTRGMVRALQGLTGYRPQHTLRRDLADALPIPAQYRSGGGTVYDAEYWAENNRLLRKILDYHQQQEQTQDRGDHFLVKRGGVTTKYPKKK